MRWSAGSSPWWRSPTALPLTLALALTGCLAGRIQSGETEGGGLQAEDDQATTDEDTGIELDLLANDFNPRGDPLSITAVEVPHHGVVSRSGSKISYQPDRDFFGADSFTYVVSDAAQNSDTATVTITIRPLNDPPIALAPESVTTAEDVASQTFTLTGSDPEDPETSLVINVTDGPSHGTLSATAGSAPLTVRLTPEADFFGLDLCAITVSDPAGATSTAQILFIVDAINDAPMVTINAGLTVPQGGIAILGPTALLYSDADHAPADLVYRLDTLPQNGALRLSATPLTAGGLFSQADVDFGRLDYDHNGLTVAADSFSFTASDGEANVGGTFNLTITPVGDAPVLVTNQPLTVNEGEGAVLSDLFLDTADSDTAAGDLIYRLGLAPDHGTLRALGTPLDPDDTFSQTQIDAGDVSYEHLGSETTADAFAFTVTDGNDTVAGSFAILVTPVNDAPLLVNNLPLNLDEGQSGTITVALLSASDVDNSANELVYLLATSPSEGVLSKDASTLFTGSTFTQTDLEAGSIVYAHTGASDPNDSFSFSLGDGSTSLSGNVFHININLANRLPVALPVAKVTVLVDATSGNITLTGFDNEDLESALTVEITAGPFNGTLSPPAAAPDNAPLVVTYTPNPGFTGSDAILFTVTDSAGGVSPAETVDLEVVGPLTTTIDDTDDVGQDVCLVRSGSWLLAAYHDATNGQIKIARSDDQGSQWTVLPAVATGSQPSLRAEGAELFLSFYDPTAGDLMFAHSADRGDTWPTLVTVDAGGDVGQYSALQPEPAANIYVSYYDATNLDLKVATSNNAGANWGSVTVAGAGAQNVGEHTAIGFKGTVILVSTFDDSADNVVLARGPNRGAVWDLFSAANTAAVTSGGHSALTVDGSSTHIVYYDGGAGALRYARTINEGAAWSERNDIDASGDVGPAPAVAASGATVYVSYHDASLLDLRFARSEDTGATWTVLRLVDDAGDVGSFSAVAIDPPLVFIAYYDTAGALKFARSSDQGDSW